MTALSIVNGPRPTYPAEIKDVDGTVVAVHKRVDMPPDDKHSTAWKMYPWYLPGAKEAGLNGTKPVDLPLYNSERLRYADSDTHVWIVEGEKDCNALQQWFDDNDTGRQRIALGTTCGAPSTPSEAVLLGSLRGHPVTLWSDNDDVGFSHMARIGRILYGGDGHRTGTKVDVVKIPAGAGPSDGAADAIAADIDVDALDVEAFETWAKRVERPDRPYVPTKAGTWYGDASADADHGEPATDPAGLLDEVADFLGRYVIFPSDEHRDAVVLWIALSYVYDEFDQSPRLALISSDPRCGKSRVLELLHILAANGLKAADMTAPVMFRLIDSQHPTVLFDEVDAIFGKHTANEHEGLRALINSGYEKGTPVWRCVGDGTNIKVVPFDVYAPLALAAIKRLPDTIMDRSVVVRMKRRGPHETVEPYEQDNGRLEGEPLQARLGTWSRQIRGTLQRRPDMPDGVEDRAKDVWKPLIAVADAAGGGWPERGRAACTVCLQSEADGGVPSMGIQLLIDIRTVFDMEGVDRLSSADLVAGLCSIEDAPWRTAGFGSTPLQANGLSRRLDDYKISPKSIRQPLDWGKKMRGYQREWFEDAWTRYCPPVGTEEVFE
jgi:Protein of unknown function (DUF3631)